MDVLLPSETVFKHYYISSNIMGAVKRFFESIRESGSRQWFIALIVVVCCFIAFTVTYDQLIREGVEYEFVQFNSGPRIISAVVGKPTVEYAGTLPGVVIYHGVMASKEWMLSYVHALANAGMFAMAIDQAGHGASTGLLTNTALGDDGVAALKFISTLAAVDPTRLGIIGWSMGGGTALQVSGRVSVDEGLKSVVLVGANLNFANVIRKLKYWSNLVNANERKLTAKYSNTWNATSPPNLMLAIGRNDELVNPVTSRSALSNITEGVAAGELIPLDETVGNFSDYSARRIFLGPSNHVFEAIDHRIIEESVNWMRNSLGPGATAREFNYAAIDALTALGGLAGLMAWGLLCLALTFPRFYKEVDDSEFDSSKFKYRPYWWLIHNLLWIGCFLAGLITNFIPLPVRFYALLWGAFFFAMIVFFLYYWRVCLVSSFKLAIKAPFMQVEKKSLLIISIIFLVWLTMMNAILYHVPWMFGFGTPLFKSLNVLDSDLYRRYLIMVILWIPMFFCWVYEMSIVRFYSWQAWAENDVKINRNSLRFKIRMAFEIIASRLWAFVALLLVVVISVAGAQARIFGALSFIVLFLFPLVAYFLFISIVTIPAIFGRRLGPVEIAFIHSGVISYFAASILPFGY